VQILSQVALSLKFRGILRSTIALWAAVVMYCAIASASAPGIPVLPGATISHGLVTPWVVADLDGDHRPDLANSNPTGVNVQGFQYRVEFQLSSGLASEAFTVSTSNHLGLNIVPRDVDGDHDLDLVITSGALREPVGIWLNDGKGGFSQADASLYPVEDRTENIWQFQASIDQSCLTCTDEARRPSCLIPSASIHGPPANGFSRNDVGSSDSVSSDLVLQNLTRGPPASLRS
jgi:hypothetical protein